MYWRLVLVTSYSEILAVLVVPAKQEHGGEIFAEKVFVGINTFVWQSKSYFAHPKYAEAFWKRINEEKKNDLQMMGDFFFDLS